ncbi:MAG TPA: PAS domain S-box protein [Desulfomonilia bacterium]|nr:PAS domain S-box protein [Deltaproteobacteria bacterium]HRS56101.1 PAS domain S-box protein [Desulfomonilia bacterium]HRV35782.1 PAS domain S-box protein [Desulfomonilia bacterium]
MRCSPPTPPSVRDLHREISRLRRMLAETENKADISGKPDPVRLIFEEILHLLCLLRPDGVITYANPAFCTCLGKTKSETLGKSLFGLLPRNDRRRFMMYMESLTPMRPVREFEYRTFSADGEARWYQWTIKALFDESGRPVDYILAGSDITMLKGIEEDLIDALEKYATLFESTNDAIILLDSTRFIDCNTAALKIFRSRNKEEFLKGGFEILSFSDPQNGAQVKAEIDRHLELALKKGMERFQWTFRRTDGSVFPADIILSPFPLGNRKIIAAIIRDISDLKNTEEALKAAHSNLEKKVEIRTRELMEVNEALKGEIQERRKIENELKTSEEHHRRISEELDVVLNGITDIIMLNDKNLNIIWANKTASEISGLSPEAIRVRKCHEALWRRSSPCEECPLLQAMKTGRHREGTMKTPDGSLWEIAGYPVRDERGSIRGVIEIVRNITDRKIIEEETQKRYKLDSLGTLAGGIAHDFNNILTVIMGNVSFAKMLLSSEDRLWGRLDDIEKASMRARELTSQLMTFSRGGSPMKKPVAIDQLLRDTIHFSLQDSDVTARFHIDSGLWRVDADEAQMGQVIGHIIKNAQDAMPQGGSVNVAVENTLVEEGTLPLSRGRYVKISISDTGCGIEESIMGSIFDPFFTTKKKRNGLGLATSYSIVRKHGGHIAASSVSGRGTTFTLYLPAAAEEGQGELPGPQETYAGKGRILFMDDEAFIRDLAMSLLSHLGYELTFAREGNEAIEAYKKALREGTGFDAVILDLTVVEGMGGKECIRELKKIDPHVRAIVSSGYSNDPIMADPGKYGFSGLIAKPYNIQSLSAVLKKIIEEKRDET